MSTILSGMYDPDAAPEARFAALPAGPYTVKIDAGEVRKTKAGDGHYLQLELLVVEGEYEGRKIFVLFNLGNKNERAVQIANAQFAALREAVGVLKPKDVEDLKNIRFQVMLKLAKKREKQPDGVYRETDEMVNEVARYIKKGQSASGPRQGGGGNPHARNAPRPADDPAPWDAPRRPATTYRSDAYHHSAPPLAAVGQSLLRTRQEWTSLPQGTRPPVQEARGRGVRAAGVASGGGPSIGAHDNVASGQAA